MNLTSHTKTYHQTHYFQVCIHKESLCDLSDDCGEGEDEEFMRCIAYHRLTLEDDSWLSWFSQDTVDDDFDWTMGSGNTESQGMCVCPIYLALCLHSTSWNDLNSYTSCVIIFLGSLTISPVTITIPLLLKVGSSFCEWLLHHNLLQHILIFCSVCFKIHSKLNSEVLY